MSICTFIATDCLLPAFTDTPTPAHWVGVVASIPPPPVRVSSLADTAEDVQSSQIYRELNRMAEKGWGTSRNVIQNDRPNKKIYSITQDGLNALNEWINESAVLFENPHDPLLMRVFFGANSPE